MRTFVKDKNGKPCADTGKHDDCVMALAGAVQLHQRCPMGGYEDYAFLNKQRAERADIAVAGEYDTEDDDDLENELVYSRMLYGDDEEDDDDE